MVLGGLIFGSFALASGFFSDDKTTDDVVVIFLGIVMGCLAVLAMDWYARHRGR